MSRWWRAYDEAVDDPKLQQLPGELFKAWFNLCCVTSQNGGKLPSIQAVAFKLRTNEHKAAAILTRLHAAGLLDKTDDGFRPHNWDCRQYKSDVSNERVKQFRERQRNGDCNVTCNGAVTPSESDQKQIRTERGFPQGGGSGKANGWSPPKHGAQSSKHKTIYIRQGTSEWELYAEDHRKALGVDPVADENGGRWFPCAGAAQPIPEAKRFQRN